MEVLPDTRPPRWGRARARLAGAAAFLAFQAAAPPDAAAPSLSSLRELIDTGDFAAAIRAGETLVVADPGDSETHDLLGRAYGLEAKDSAALTQLRLARKARAAFAHAVALDPSNAAALSDLATYDMRAPALLGGGRAKARREAEAVLRLDASRGHELLGALAELESDRAAAETEYRRSLEAAPEDLRGRRALSGFLVRQKRFSEARGLWLALRERGAGDPVPGYELGGIALEAGDELGPALDDLKACLETAPSADGPRPAEVLARMALVAARLGHKAEARAHLTEALRLEPRHRGWQRDLARLPR